MWKVNWATCALVLVAATVTGCSTDERAQLPPIPVVSQAGTAVDLSLPLDAYELSPGENHQVQRAVLRTLGNCLDAFGLQVPLPETRMATYPVHATQLNWLGVYDVARYGYQGPPGFAEEMSAAARRGSRPIAFSNEALAVFIGEVATHAGRPVPAGGCDGESQRAVNGSQDPPTIAGIDPAVPAEQGIQWLEQQAADRARADKRFHAVTDQWRECMNRRGYRYATPDEAQSDPRWNGDQSENSASPSRDELDTALADRACREATNMSGVLKYLITEQENQIIDTRSDTVHQVSDLLRRRAGHAARILGEPRAG
ncbi:hypothetical protein [Dactylosporangium sp. CA-233914]|uniref:hypothetical protein n=1 Tax=Dactylosporangium sp. CA-233914 TaxID=3239934 RepID=UPI003D929059